MPDGTQLLRINGFAGFIGCNLVAWEQGLAELQLELQQKHLNVGGSLHGGVIMTLMDVAGGRAGCWTSDDPEGRLAVTLSLTTNFTGQIRSGTVRAIGRVRSSGRKIFTSGVDVFDERERLIATAVGTYKYRELFQKLPEGRQNANNI